MTPRLACLLVAVVLGASAGGCSDKVYCSPCPPGTKASDPAVSCSACVPIDGGADAD